MVSQPQVNPPRSNSGCYDCLGKIPYASLISFLFTCLGVGLFCGLCYQAVNISVEQWRKLSFTQQMTANIPWLDKVQLTFMIVAIVMSIFALVLLIVGCLATGSTRDRIYSGWRARLGGRISCALLLLLTYICLLVWFLIFAASSVTGAVYFFLRQLCSVSVASHSSPSFGGADRCLDLSIFKPMTSGSRPPPPGAGATFPVDLSDSWLSGGGGGDEGNFRVCSQDLSDFCQLTRQASDWFALSWGACLLVIVGLVHFLICLSANYAHIKDGFKYFELEEIRSTEENEMMATYGQHSVYRR